MEPVYQVWQHRESGRCYSVRLEWNALRRHLVITGVCQPPDPTAIQQDGTVEAGWYETGAAAQALEARRKEFIVLLPRAPWRARPRR